MQVIHGAKSQHPRSVIHITSLLPHRSNPEKTKDINAFVSKQCKIKGCRFINTAKKFTGKDLYRDEKHPNKSGTGVLVQTIKNAIGLKRIAPITNTNAKFEPKPKVAIQSQNSPADTESATQHKELEIKQILSISPFSMKLQSNQHTGSQLFKTIQECIKPILATMLDHTNLNSMDQINICTTHIQIKSLT